jgi:hypothetical protein
MYYVIRRSKTGPHMSSYDLLAVPEDTRIPKAAWKFGAAGIEVVFSSPYREKVVQYQRGMLGADIREWLARCSWTRRSTWQSTCDL